MDEVTKVVYTKRKAIAAAITTSLGVVTLFTTSIADGVLSSGEVGNLVGAVFASAATVGAVFGVDNKKLSVD